MLNLLNKSHTNVHTIAYILGTVSIFGYVVSFVRDRVFAHYFGPSELLDIYIASFRIPDLLFIVVTAFLSVYAILPMFEEKQRQGRAVLKEFINTTFYFLLLFLVFGLCILFFAIPVIEEHVFTGFSGEASATFILFSRIFLVQATLFAISSFLTAILQLKRKFFLYSTLPILYNLGIIFGAMILYPLYGPIGLAIGVVIGTTLSLSIQLPIIIRNGLMPLPIPTQRMAAETWKAILLSLPRASGLLSMGIASVVIFGVIISLSEGTLSVYYFAESLKSVPLIIAGTAYAVASFPILVNHFTNQDMVAFREIVESMFRRLFFFILPLIAYIFILREPLISVFFETGLFTPEAALITSTMLGIFVFSALTTSILIICARVLYACGRSLIPFLVFLSLALSEIVAVILVVRFLQSHREQLTVVLEWTNLSDGNFGILFSAIATIVALEVVAAVVIFFVLTRIINQRLLPIVRALLEHGIATGVFVAVIITVQIILFTDIQYNTVHGVGAIISMTGIGALFWYGTLRALRNEESRIVQVQIMTALSRFLHK